MADHDPEQQARIENEIRTVESQFAAVFAGMETDAFIDQGVSIFRSAAEGIPVVNEAADNAVKAVLDAVVKAEAPEPFIGVRTAIAWRMYTAELVKRTVKNQGVEFRHVPLEAVPVPDYSCDGWTPESAAREIPHDISLAEDLLANLRIGGATLIEGLARDIEDTWFEHIVVRNPTANPAQHHEEAANVADKYKQTFEEMVAQDDASILRRGLDDHDFSHVVQYVSGCAEAVYARMRSGNASSTD